LHRVEEGKTVLVPWVSLWEQFGNGYAQIRQFRWIFTRTLKQVRVVYPEAKFDLNSGGMDLTRFCGHLSVYREGVRNGEQGNEVSSGISQANG